LLGLLSRWIYERWSKPFMGHNEGNKVFELSLMIGKVRRRILLYTIESFLAIIFRGYGTSFFHHSIVVYTNKVS